MKRVILALTVFLVGLSCFGQDWEVKHIQADEFLDREAYTEISSTGLSGTEPYCVSFDLYDSYMFFTVVSNVVFDKNVHTGQVGFTLGFYDGLDLVARVNSDRVTYRYAGLSMVSSTYKGAFFKESNKGSGLYLKYSDDELIDMIQQGKVERILNTRGNTAHAIFAWLSSSESRSVRMRISVYSGNDLDIVLPSLIDISL